MHASRLRRSKVYAYEGCSGWKGEIGNSQIDERDEIPNRKENTSLQQMVYSEYILLVDKEDSRASVRSHHFISTRVVTYY